MPTATFRASTKVSTSAVTKVAAPTNTERNKRGDPATSSLELFLKQGLDQRILFPTCLEYSESQATDADWKSYKQIREHMNHLVPPAASAAPSGQQQQQPDFENVKLLHVTAKGMNLPLIKTVVNVKVWSEMVENTTMRSQQQEGQDEPRAELHMTILDTNVESSGPKAAVWMFDKVMGKQKKENKKTKTSSKKTDDNDDGIDDTADPESISFRRIYAEPTDDGKSMKFTMCADVEVRVKLSKTTTRVLPISQEKIESMGSNGIQEELDKDIALAMEKLEKAYSDWCNALE